MNKDIATLLREIKAISGWSEPRIATELGTSQPTVNRILNGQTDCKGSTLRAIEELYSLVCCPSEASQSVVRRTAAPEQASIVAKGKMN